MSFKPIKGKDGSLPKITEKMAKSAVKIDSGAIWRLWRMWSFPFRYAFMDLSKVLPMPFEDYEPNEESREFMRKITGRMFIDRRKFYV